MIKFTEITEARINFISYPIGSFFGYFVLLFSCVLLLYWELYFSPIDSSLTCRRVFLNTINCQLQEKSILNSSLTQLDIHNVKKIAINQFGDRDLRIKIKANPNPPYFDINRFQKTYFYPSNPFSLVLFRNFNPLNWFTGMNQLNQLDNFVRGKLHQPILSLELKIKGAEFLIMGLFIGMPFLFIFSVFTWFFTAPVFNSYEIDLENQSLTILGQRIFLKNIEWKYQLDRIKQVRLDTDYKTNFNRGRIILEFEPDYDYPIDEFTNVQKGEENFQVIKDFLAKNK